jgi:O-acetyl-ADP-ribose deacetylase (regulator of RNase III)
MNIVKGNLIDLAENGDFDIIVHGANCHCTMGSGIAREIRARYPSAYAIDASTEQGDYNKLGNYTMVPAGLDRAESKFVIVNAYTQYNFNGSGVNGQVFNDVFEYDSFKLILQKLAYLYPTARFGFPAIGMGLAGGNKTRIMGMLAEFSLTVTESGGSFTLVEFA